MSVLEDTRLKELGKQVETQQHQGLAVKQYAAARDASEQAAMNRAREQAYMDAVQSRQVVAVPSNVDVGGRSFYAPSEPTPVADANTQWLEQMRARKANGLAGYGAQ